jgi:hypothetical protein
LKYSSLLHIVTAHRNTLLSILALLLADSAAALASPWIGFLIGNLLVDPAQPWHL